MRVPRVHLAMPCRWGLTRPKQLSMATGFLSSCFILVVTTFYHRAFITVASLRIFVALTNHKVKQTACMDTVGFVGVVEVESANREHVENAAEKMSFEWLYFRVSLNCWKVWRPLRSASEWCNQNHKNIYQVDIKSGSWRVSSISVINWTLTRTEMRCYSKDGIIKFYKGFISMAPVSSTDSADESLQETPYAWKMWLRWGRDWFGTWNCSYYTLFSLFHFWSFVLDTTSVNHEKLKQDRCYWLLFTESCCHVYFHFVFVANLLWSHSWCFVWSPVEYSIINCSLHYILSAKERLTFKLEGNSENKKFNIKMFRVRGKSVKNNFVMNRFGCNT